MWVSFPLSVIRFVWRFSSRRESVFRSLVLLLLGHRSFPYPIILYGEVLAISDLLANANAFGLFDVSNLIAFLDSVLEPLGGDMLHGLDGNGEGLTNG